MTKSMKPKRKEKRQKEIETWEVKMGNKIWLYLGREKPTVRKIKVTNSSQFYRMYLDEVVTKKS